LLDFWNEHEMSRIDSCWIEIEWCRF